ncbi:MAG TPA: hypothetical protein DET40_19595 [Lentisphaeria bacterium]|nr:MAG: hypothetical protein A2X45_18425 [Lentisphaerae bacterium GWF2_50_93]HCE45753.1 hypothetical protein [Lentisphaeria bacterium]
MKKTKSNTEIEKALRDFIAGAEKSFNAENAAEEIAEVLKLDTKELIPEVEKLLAADNSLLDITCEGELRENYISRRKFFDKAEFCISPTQAELDKGVLFPGHRFVPFLNPDIPPFDAVLKSDESGTGFEMKAFKDYSMDALEQYHSLLGVDLTLRYYVQNDKDNSESIGESRGKKAKLNMKVYDLKEFYKKHSFKMGDALIVSVEDSDKGVFRFSILPGSEKQSHLADIQNWVSRMEDALLAVFDVYGPAMDIKSQLEQAFILNPTLMENVFISYGEFLKISAKVGVKPMGKLNSILWHKEENPVDSVDVKSQISISAGSVDSLEKILQDLGVGLLVYEIEAFMRDELYNGRQSMDGVRKRCFAGRELVFKDEAQKIAFENFLDELWEEVLADYDKSADEENGRLRARALALIEDQMSFLRRLDALKVLQDQIPKEEMLTFSEISNVLGQLLNVLNNTGNNFKKEEIETMLVMLDETVDTISIIKASMTSKIPGLEQEA